MFTAIILVCLSQSAYEPDNCYQIIGKRASDTEQECMVNIAKFYSDYAFLYEWFDETREDSWKMVDFKCVEWERKTEI